MARTSVDLPHPLAPSTATAVPARTPKLTPRTVTRSDPGGETAERLLSVAEGQLAVLMESA